MKVAYYFKYHTVLCMSMCPKGYTNYEDDEGHWLINLNQKKRKKEKDNFVPGFMRKRNSEFFFLEIQEERTRF